MNYRQMIISTYYANPDNDDRKIANAICSKRMDVVQLLLMERVVFHERNHKHVYTDKGIRICPCGNIEHEYWKLIIKGNPTLAAAQVIEAKNASMDPDIFKNLCNEQKSNLYYEVVLVESINGTCLLEERNSLRYEVVYGASKGEVFIDLLIFAAIQLISAYQKDGSKGASTFLQCLRKELQEMENICNDSQDFLWNMETRELIWAECSIGGPLLAMSQQCHDKIRKIRASSSMMDFLYSENKKGRKYACQLLAQIRRIGKVLTSEKVGGFSWDEEVKTVIQQKNVPPIFIGLDKLIQELEADQKLTFRWSSQYIKEMDRLNKARD